MATIKHYEVLSTEEERALFERLDTIQEELCVQINKTAVFYNRVPGLMFMLANGHEQAKNVVKAHKLATKNINLQPWIISTLEEYQKHYQDKVIYNKDTGDDLAFMQDMQLDYSLVKEYALEVQEYTGDQCVIDMHVSCEDLEEIQYKITDLLREMRKIENTIANHNLRLVVKIAKQIHFDGCGASLDDLVQEGSLSLMKAMQRYDVSTGNKFSTMATYWIDSGMRRFIQNHGKAVRIPVNVQDHLSKAKKVRNQMTLDLKRPPTQREVADKLGLTVSRYQEILESEFAVQSLDTPAGEEDEGSTLVDLIRDITSDIEVVVYTEQLGMIVNDALDMLNENERQVVEMRHGFGDYEPMSLGECAQQLGCTKPTVMNRENKALEKIKGFLYATLTRPE